MRVGWKVVWSALANTECCPPTTLRKCRRCYIFPVPNLCPFAERILTEILIQPTLCCSVIHICTCLKECTVYASSVYIAVFCTYLYNSSKDHYSAQKFQFQYIVIIIVNFNILQSHYNNNDIVSTQSESSG